MDTREAPARGVGVAVAADGAASIDLDDLSARAREAIGDVDASLELARSSGAAVPLPASGRTDERWGALASLGAVDLTVARLVEPHLDALAILAESGAGVAPDLAPASTTWGVYAAEGPGARLVARPAAGGGDARLPGGWRLDGVKPWCSLAGVVDHALVTAWVDATQRGLFAVALRQPGVEVAEGGWVSHGLRDVPSTPTSYDDAVATALGGPGWYLRRDGFAWGGIGVAAVWYGGAVGLARRLRRQAHERELDQIGRAHLGLVDTALHAARAALAESAVLIDGGSAAGERGAVLALRVRGVVAETVETVLRVTDHALGPAPLAFEEEHATRVSDLRVYVRQHHAERDAAALGAVVAGRAVDDEPW